MEHAAEGLPTEHRSRARPRSELSVRAREALLAYALLLPSLVIFAVFAYYPLAQLVRYGLYRPNRFGNGEVYVGPANFTKVLGGVNAEAAA